MSKQATESYNQLIANARSVQLATVDTEGRPDVSYAPVLIEEDRSLYILVSELSKHTANLQNTGVASAMLIEDEAAAAQLFARRRVTYDCQVETIERESKAWIEIVDRMQAQHGDIIKGLRQLEDFHLIRLAPQSGRLVVGFGQAFDVSGQKMEKITHVGGGGQGHRRERKKKSTAAT